MVQTGGDGCGSRNVLALGASEITTQMDCKVITLDKEDNGRYRLLWSFGENVPLNNGGSKSGDLSRIPLTLLTAGHCSVLLKVCLDRRRRRVGLEPGDLGTGIGTGRGN